MDTAQTPGGSPGEQILVATVPTPDMMTAEGLTGEKTATSFGTYAYGGDGGGNDSMMSVNGPGGTGPDLTTDAIAGVDRSGSNSMQDESGARDTGPVHANMSWGGQTSDHTENSMSQYVGSAYESGNR